jgi:D-alanyl-D-alanine carboxypeptidase
LVPIGTSRDGKITHLARPDAVAAFRQMSEAAWAEKVGLHIIWAYRPPDVQAKQFEEAKRKRGPRQGIQWLAPPGFSEHQTGWALDIGDQEQWQADDNPLFAQAPAYRWLEQNAGRFGFELSFKPGNWQGVTYEPWHWRYMGSPAARQTFHPTGWRAVSVWGRSFAEALRWWLRWK